jgi:hypothetical protein
MPAKWVILFLMMMNVALLFMSSTLTVNVRALAGRERIKEVEAFQLEGAKLMGERTRLEAKVGLLADAVKRLEAAIEKASSRSQSSTPPASEPPNGEGEAEKARFLSVLESEFPSGKPDTSSIPFLSKEEMDSLLAYSARCPRLDSSVLSAGDVDTLLRDPKWNPAGIDLKEEERKEVQGLLRDYRYFSKFALIEATELMVVPEIPRLREAGAFIEYPSDQTPPDVQGVAHTHSESSDKPGTYRLYCFYPDDYPALYHHKRVAGERALETGIKVHRLLNPEGPSGGR